MCKISRGTEKTKNVIFHLKLIFELAEKVFKIHVFKKATKIDEILTIDLILCSRRKIDGDIINIF